MDSLQLILIIGLIFMALINAACLIWAFTLDHRLRQRPKPPTPKIYEVHLDASKVLAEVDLSALQHQTSEQLSQSMHEAAKHLKDSVDGSVEQIAGHINEMATTTLSAEFEKYQVSLNALREQTIHEFSKLQQEIDERKETLIIELNQSLNTENQKRIEQFNARLNDVVASYIAESLGSQVDLGAQLPYILQTLQEHRDDIKKDVLS